MTAARKGVAADELVGRPSAALWRSQLNAGTLARRFAVIPDSIEVHFGALHNVLGTGCPSGQWHIAPAVVALEGRMFASGHPLAAHGALAIGTVTHLPRACALVRFAMPKHDLSRHSLTSGQRTGVQLRAPEGGRRPTDKLVSGNALLGGG